MYLSRRTVETHVSHALAKLNCSIRQDLAAAAVRNLKDQ
jgi:DNA-binding CsgD family transcriptional regulator